VPDRPDVVTWRVSVMPKTLRRIFMILNFKTAVVTALAVLST
jgi:hypothetical protein